MGFAILHEDKKTKARVGLLTTKSGAIETPFFMPVATKTAVKHISPDDLETMRAEAIICNAYILSLRPGVDIIKKQRGIGRFMSYKGIVFTDSGGFQMYSPQLYLGSNDDGVNFRNPFSGEQRFITPEKDMEIQLSLGSDVAMCLDSMPLIEDSREDIEEAVRKTTLWAKRCKGHHDSLQSAVPQERRQLLFGITQGGIHVDLRKRSAKEIAAIDFDGYAVGGLALGEPKKDEYRMIEIVKEIMPNNKPLYLMGAGNPPELIEAIARGADMFDSRFPTQNARRGTLFSTEGYLRVTNSSYTADTKPIDSACDCFVCKRFSRAYMRHLLRLEEPVGMRLASYHNLYFLHTLLRKARMAITEGTFGALRNEIKKSYGK